MSKTSLTNNKNSVDFKNVFVELEYNTKIAEHRAENELQILFRNGTMGQKISNSLHFREKINLI